MTSEVTDCDPVLLGLIREKKAVHVSEINQNHLLCPLSTPPPLPSKIKMYGPVICWQKKTSIEFYIYSK